MFVDERKEYGIYIPKDMKLGIQDKWELYYLLVDFLMVEGNYQSKFADKHGFSTRYVNRMVDKLKEYKIIREKYYSTYKVYEPAENWHYYLDRLTPTPSYKGNLLYPLKTRMRPHANNGSNKISIKSSPDPMNFAKKKNWKYIVNGISNDNNVTYSLTHDNQFGSIHWQGSTRKATSTVILRPVNNRFYDVSSSNWSASYDSIKNDYQGLMYTMANDIRMDFDYPKWMDGNALESKIDIAFENVSDVMYSNIVSHKGTMIHCLPEIGYVKGDRSANPRTRKKYFSKGEWPEMNYSSAKVYIDKLEKDEEIYDPFTHQYVIPSIGQATHNARVGDKS